MNHAAIRSRERGVLEAKIDDLSDELDKVRLELGAAVGDSEQAADDATVRIEEVELQLSQKNAEFVRVNVELDRIKSELAETQSDYENCENTLSRRSRSLRINEERSTSSW